jgi:hypothetical protein
LKITSDRPRILPCEYCHSDVFLPDEVWVRLHPVETGRRFYVRFEGRTRAELRREAAERLAHDETEARARAGAAAYQAAQARIESDRAARHERVSAALARAWAATLVFATCMLILLGFALFAGPRGLGELLPLTIVLAVPTCVSLFVATHLAGKPMTETTGHAFEWILFVTWFWVPFVMFAPIFGQVIGLVRVVMLALGRVSGGTITSGGNRTHYDPVRFGMGEGRPAAVLFLVLTLVWPLVVLCLGALEDA